MAIARLRSDMLGRILLVSAFSCLAAWAQRDVITPYRVHIAPSNNDAQRSSITMENDRWIARDVTLKAALASAYEVPAGRVDLPAALDNGKRYNVTLLMPHPDPDAAPGLVRQALRDYFHVAIRRQSRLRDVYVMTAPNGKPPALEPVSDAASVQASTHLSNSKIEARAASIAMLGRLLEKELGRPVIDETGLTGRYNFTVDTGADDPGALRPLLQAKLGLQLSPARRPVEMLVVRRAR